MLTIGFALAVLCLWPTSPASDLGVLPEAPEGDHLRDQAKANQAPTAIDLKPDQDGPKKAGSRIIWTGTATDPEGDPLLYQFWLNGASTGHTWRAMTNWTESNIWTWTTSSEDVGNSIIQLRVRDGNHADASKWDSMLTSEYLLEEIGGGKPTLVTLKPDRPSPQPQGTTIVWTAEASDPDGDTILYQYWLKGPSTQDQWTAQTFWTTNNRWTWKSHEWMSGIYTVEARVRDGYHAGSEGFDDFERATYVIRHFVE